MDFSPIEFYFERILSYNLLKVALELFLIGLVVWWVVNFLEGTRGARLFRGVFFILVIGSLVLNLIVEQFDFERIEFLYNGFLLAVLIMAVAAFQPELRRALIRIGQTGFANSPNRRIARAVDEIVSAVEHMSISHTGAIMVIEEQVGLKEYIETGVKIDAVITAQLIETIFYEGTPLHDMAVVIRGDRIIAAGVQLPLAERGTVELVELGSRHRAAIGISLTTDATVIVVSEETGIISVATDGNLNRKIAPATLSVLLSKAVKDTPSMGKVLHSDSEFEDEKEGGKGDL
jgi:diadenylate cyclase